MKGVSYKSMDLFLDVAPIPEENLSLRTKVVDIAKKYFGNVIVNLPSERNFPKAMDWCWSSAEADYLFHLEDDWRLEKDFHIDELFAIAERDEKILQVSLRHFPGEWQGVTFCPGLLKKAYYKAFAGKFIHNQDKKVYMSFQGNPEAFMRRIQWDLGITYENTVMYPKDVIVADIGYKWKQSREFFKNTYLSQYKSE